MKHDSVRAQAPAFNPCAVPLAIHTGQTFSLRCDAAGYGGCLFAMRKSRRSSHSPEGTTLVPAIAAVPLVGWAKTECEPSPGCRLEMSYILRSERARDAFRTAVLYRGKTLWLRATKRFVSSAFQLPGVRTCVNALLNFLLPIPILTA